MTGPTATAERRSPLDYAMKLTTTVLPFIDDDLLKPPPLIPPSRLFFMEPEDDLDVLATNLSILEDCGYYYGNLSWQEAGKKLKNCSSGTFLIRDSEHPDFLYALSVQTPAGPTSCRILYSDGHFLLDSVLSDMPRFRTVVDLATYYMEKTSSTRYAMGGLKPVWLERSKKEVPVQIHRPLYKEVCSLRTLCRDKVLSLLRDRYPFPSMCRRTLERDAEFRSLPRSVQDYLLKTSSS